MIKACSISRRSERERSVWTLVDIRENLLVVYFLQQLMEISAALPDLNLSLGHDMNDDDDDDVHLGHDKRRIPRVSYDKDKNNGDISSIDIYKPYLDDDDEEDEDDEHGRVPIPFDSERYQPKLDR